MTEHEHLEAIAVAHDAKADDLFTDFSNGEHHDVTEAQAHRRAAEIIRYQIECEA